MVYVLIGIAVLILLFVIFVASRPGAFRIERSIVIAAPAQRAFDQVNDFHAWAAWSPWDKMDPAMQRTYAGPPAGVGTTYAWVGNKQVGEGKMTIERSEAPSNIVIKLEFFKPFVATNTATFTFTPESGGTKVNWAMDGTKNFMFKAFCLFMNMDKTVGKEFEKGLAAMKSVAEAA